MSAVPMEHQSEQFTYDVAFSFCKEDEGLANELADFLGDRFKTFVYSRQQEVLAGKDGEEAFNCIFGRRSRLVVILHRAKWGTTPFTRIEETAIKNRAFNKGYNFTVWVSMEEPGNIPQYVPKARLYLGLRQYGVKSATAVIEARIQDQGGEALVESVTDKAKRLKRQMESEKERRAFLKSDAAVHAARQEFQSLLESLTTNAKKITDATGWGFRFKVSEREGFKTFLDIGTEHAWMAIDWKQSYSNTLDEAGIRVAIWDGLPNRLGRTFVEERRRHPLTESIYEFDRTIGGEVGWSRAGNFVSARSMADHCLELLIERSHAKSIKHR